MSSGKENAFGETHSVWFLGLNGAIFLFGFFLIEVKNDLHRHFDPSLALHKTSPVIHYTHALAISWYHPNEVNEEDFLWTEVIDSLIYAHSLFLISSALLAIITWPFNKSPSTFTTYCLLLSTAMILRVFVLTSCMEPSSRLYSTTIQSALSELEWSYRILTNSTYVSSLNTFMINAECCGFYGPLDFTRANLTIHTKDFLYAFDPYKGADLYFPTQEVKFDFKIPPVCCKPYLFNRGNPKQRFDSVAQCAQGADLHLQQWTGCLKRIEEHVWDKRIYLTILLALMFATEVSALTIAIFLTFQENRVNHSEGEQPRDQVKEKEVVVHVNEAMPFEDN